MRHVVEADPAVLFWDGPAEKAERRHLPEHVLREDLAAIALPRARRDLLVGEVLRELADGLLLGREIEVHAGSYAEARCAERSRIARSASISPMWAKQPWRMPVARRT